MGCFLGCFGGEKEKDQRRRRRHRVNRRSPQRARVQNVQQETKVVVETPAVEEAPAVALVTSESQNKHVEDKQLSPSPSPSPKKRVTFNSNVTTHVVVQESIESLSEFNTNIKKEEEDFKRISLSEDDNSVISSVGSYPTNHRYHNARDSDDESEVYDDSDLEDLDDYDEDSDEDDDMNIAGQQVWSESVVTESVESNTHDEEFNDFRQKTNTRYRSDYVNSVLNPVENSSQWKAVKSKGAQHVKQQKENLSSNFEAPRLSFSSEPTFRQAPKSDQPRSKNQEIAIDSSLSSWLVSPEVLAKKTMSEGSSALSFEDRPILGALTVDELRQMSAASASPRKSPSRSPDDMPIIGSVGTYWNNSASSKRSDSASSYKGTAISTGRYRTERYT